MMRTLDTIIRVHYGKSLKADARTASGRWPVYGSNGEVGRHDKALVATPTLIIGRKGSVGSVTFAPKGGWVIDTAFYTEIIDPGEVDLRYLYYALRELRLEKHKIVTSIPGIGRDDIYNSAIPLPPLPEQKRIADILDKADAIRRKRAQALELTDQFLQSVFLDMFGDPVTNPKGWEEAGIEEVCELIVDCVNRTAPVVPGPTDYKMIRTTNVKNGVVDLSNVRYVTRETFEVWNRRATPRTGDVLLTREAPVGEAGILRSEENVFLGQRLMLYRPDQDKITSEYLLYSFRGPYLQKQFEANGSGSTVKHLPLPVCRSLRIRRPPVEIQREFSRIVSQVRAVHAKQNVSQGGKEELFSTCVQRAFRGEL